MFDKILIANRGEIAVRIIRAARELGVKTVQVYSEADKYSLPVQMADESIEIGPPPAQQSYLKAEAILQAARLTEAEAIHPGYGFLAENAEFADAVEEAGISFIGPSGDVIRRMGDKAAAREAAREAGIPIIPGSNGILSDLKNAENTAKEIGFPVMIKATAGGGGRGIRIAKNAKEFLALASQSSAEAKAAFGNGDLYLEKFISNARHIEVQILGDGENFIHCFERECSIQRRRQKVWEEAPCCFLSSEIRDSLCQSAVALARTVKYRGAGTVEYLYDEKSKNFYFIEMNTRIQVEHPITECITGVDLLVEMINIASGAKLSKSQSDLEILGHAIEVRINAEDPSNNFMPFPGVVDDLKVAGGPGVRFDHFLYQSYQIPPFYDSLLGKLIVHAENRQKAILRLKRAVSELSFGNVKTTTPLFLALVDDTEINDGTFHTNWLEPWLDSNTDKLVKIGRK